jgi:hypothetical protein
MTFPSETPICCDISAADGDTDADMDTDSDTDTDSRVGSDARVGAIATICGSTANAELQCPALFLCGGEDTIAACSKMQPAFDGSPAPVMLANLLIQFKSKYYT